MLGGRKYGDRGEYIMRSSASNKCWIIMRGGLDWLRFDNVFRLYSSLVGGGGGGETHRTQGTIGYSASESGRVESMSDELMLDKLATLPRGKTGAGIGGRGELNLGCRFEMQEVRHTQAGGWRK